jgi:AcrR family transcriptional regulator
MDERRREAYGRNPNSVDSAKTARIAIMRATQKLQTNPVLDDADERCDDNTRGTKRPRRGPYVSDSILARRRRMLEVAKEMIAEGGESSFTIRDLASRAKVSVTTIYAAFGDKKGLVAAAIEDYYEDLPLAQAAPTTSLGALLAANDDVREAILSNKSYAREYAELYFSKGIDHRIYKAIQETTISSAGYLPWLQKASRDGDLISGINLKYITLLMANQRLMVLHDWAQGRISDEDLMETSKLIFLILARGITRGATQVRVEAEMKRLLRHSAPAHIAG